MVRERERERERERAFSRTNVRLGRQPNFGEVRYRKVRSHRAPSRADQQRRHPTLACTTPFSTAIFDLLEGRRRMCNERGRRLTSLLTSVLLTRLYIVYMYTLPQNALSGYIYFIYVYVYRVAVTSLMPSTNRRWKE